MFSRTRKTEVTRRIELDDETRQALAKLEGELQVLREFTADLTATCKAIVLALHGQVTIDPADDLEAAGLGVEAFADDRTGSIPPERVRDSPFKRRPASEQRAWLLEAMADGQWIHPHSFAKDLAGDEREFRYLKSAIARTCHDLHDDGRLERGSSTERGSMFRYRIRK